MEINDINGHIGKIEEALIKEYPEILCSALTDTSKRQEIKAIISKKFPHIATDDDLAEIITREIVGTGIIEKIIAEQEDVTDIAYDGTTLEVKGINYYKKIRDSNIDERYVQRLIQKFAAAKGMEFTRKNPKLNVVYENFRINAMHHANTTEGTTFSLRIVRPRLALNKSNFNQFAPDFILNFLAASVSVYSNMLIAGITGTGKTELQKLALSYTKDEKEKIGTIQDVSELFAKELFPEKTVYEWLTGNGLTFNDLIIQAMRNNFRWIIVSETIDETAYGLWQALMSGHAVITSLHAKNAMAIPKRVAQLAKFAPQAATMDMKMIEADIKELVDFGWYIDLETVNGRDFRYLNEIAVYDPNDTRLIFEQHFEDGLLHWQTYALPEEFKRKLARKKIHLDFPENQSGSFPIGGF